MISVDIALDGSGIVRQVRTCGHSGYAHKGADIVCASVSAFVQTGYILMKKMLSENAVITEDSTDGQNVLSYRIDGYPDGLRQQLQGMTLYMVTGLTEIQQQYSEYIRVNIK